jgi:ABC-type lipoprotein export system ATPase subunit
MNKLILETKNLKKIYKHKNGTIELFSNVNIKIKSGELIALVGPSGSGKTSFLHLLALLDDPTQGKILLKNKNTNNFDDLEKDKARRENISIIFQDNNLLSDFTAIENVIMPLIIKGEKIDTSYKKATKILKSIKILNRLDHFPSELSGGEQQRIAIARALISETDLILADEPTGNLDYKTGGDIFSYFLKLKKLNKAIIFATHNRELANMADYKLSISSGNIKRVNAR